MGTEGSWGSTADVGPASPASLRMGGEPIHSWGEEWPYSPVASVWGVCLGFQASGKSLHVQPSPCRGPEDLKKLVTKQPPWTLGLEPPHPPESITSGVGLEWELTFHFSEFRLQTELCFPRPTAGLNTWKRLLQIVRLIQKTLNPHSSAKGGWKQRAVGSARRSPHLCGHLPLRPHLHRREEEGAAPQGASYFRLIVEPKGKEKGRPGLQLSGVI